MSALTDALSVFINAEMDYREAVRSGAKGARQSEYEQRCVRAGEAYESALAQFTADVARHAVT